MNMVAESPAPRWRPSQNPSGQVFPDVWIGWLHRSDARAGGERGTARRDAESDCPSWTRRPWRLVRGWRGAGVSPTLDPGPVTNRAPADELRVGTLRHRLQRRDLQPRGA